MNNKLFNYILITLLIPVTNIVGGSKLPQVKATSVITGKDHLHLKSYFEAQTHLPNPFNDSIGMLLLKYLPKEYKKGCKDMIATWGTETINSSETAVKLLHLVNYSKNNQQILLVYTCFSSAKEYGDKYYDERLAVLHVDSATSSITMIPHDKECNNCTELSQIGLYEDTLKINNSPAISIIIGKTNENPCCGSTDKIEEISIKYFTTDPEAFKEQLTLVVSSEETFHNDQDEDSTVVQKNDIETIRDKVGNIISIILSTETIINGSNAKRGMVKYGWNRKRKAFEKEWN
jgi:hypothetical protein